MAPTLTSIPTSLAAALVLGAALGLLSPASAAPRSADDTAQARAQFEATAASYRKALAAELAGQTAARELLADVKFVFDRAAVPRASQWRRFGERRVTITDGWMSVVADLSRAAIVSLPPHQAPTGTVSCLAAYTAHVSETLSHNRRVTDTARGRPRDIIPFTSFTAWEGAQRCSTAARAAAFLPATDDAVANRLDAALVWAIGHELASLLRGVVSGDQAVEAANPLTECPDAEASRWSIEQMKALRVAQSLAHAGWLLHALQLPDPPDGSACRDGAWQLDDLFDRAGIPGPAATPQGIQLRALDRDAFARATAKR